MAYDKDTDFKQIQADVLTTSTQNNELIPAAKKYQTSLKNTVGAINQLYQKIQSALTNVNTSIEKSDNAQKTVTEVKENITNIVKEQITSIVSGGIRNDEFACEDNQIVFKLTKTPADPDNILFYVNGVKYLRSDQSYDAENNQVTWTGQKNDTHPNGFNLSSKDNVSIVYMAKD